MDRLKAKLNSLFSDWRVHAINIYRRLEEWIGSRYKVEIDATRDLTVLIHEAIEAEQKIPKLFNDFGGLLLSPEPSPRSESPVEIQANDQFSIAQLRILTKNLKQIAPSGTIGVKLLVDYFLKASIFAGSSDGLPDGFIGTDPTKIEKAVYSLDPFKTGYISWRKFWMIQSKLLPITLAQMKEMKKKLGLDTDKISKKKFFESRLWFENDHETHGQFNRPVKHKQALYGKYLYCSVLYHFLSKYYRPFA